MRKLVILVAGFVLSVGAAFGASEEVVVETSWGVISATLSSPDEGSDVVALIVAGSGPTDRNGNSGYGLNSWCYKMLSDELSDEGIAVMRYDKRGVGQSRLDDLSTVPDLVFEDFVDDAALCVAYLRSRGFERVVVVGHSEGGEIAQHLALRSDVAIDGVVLLCSPGFPMDTILLRQLSAQLVPQNMGLMVSATTIINAIKRGQSVAEERVPKELISLFHPSVQKFLHSSMAFDPQRLMADIALPALIVSGGRDVQVSVDNAERLMEVAQQGVYAHFESMCHVLKDAPSSDRIEQLMGIYTNSQLSLSDGLSKTIVDFITNI